MPASPPPRRNLALALLCLLASTASIPALHAQDLDRFAGEWVAELPSRLMIFNGDSLALPTTARLELTVQDEGLVGQYQFTVDMQSRESKHDLTASGTVEADSLRLSLRRTNSDQALDWGGVLSADGRTLTFPFDPGGGVPREWNGPVVFHRPSDK